MALTISDKQLEEIDSGGRPVLVWHSRTKKNYAVMSESAYDHVRPLIECMLMECTVPAEASEPTWSDAKNARRAALIHQKYDLRLTTSEKRELATLQDEVCRHQQRVAPLQNHALELIVQALEQRAQDTPPS